MARIVDKAVLEVDGDMSGLQKEVKETDSLFRRLNEGSENFATEWNQALELVKKAFEGMKMAFEAAEFAGKEMGGEFGKEMEKNSKLIKGLGDDIKMFFGVITKEILDSIRSSQAELNLLTEGLLEQLPSFVGARAAKQRRTRVSVAERFLGTRTAPPTAPKDLVARAEQFIAIHLAVKDPDALRMSGPEFLAQELTAGRGPKELVIAFRQALSRVQKGESPASLFGAPVTASELDSEFEFESMERAREQALGRKAQEEFLTFGGGPEEDLSSIFGTLTEEERGGVTKRADLGLKSGVDFKKALEESEELAQQMKENSLVMQESMSLISNATQAAMEAAISGEKSITSAIRGALKAELSAISSRAIVKAAEHTAMGFGALALGTTFGSTTAGQHFKAAAMYAGVAAVAGATSSSIPGAGAGAGAGAPAPSAPPPAGGGFFQNQTPQDEGSRTIIINVGEGFVGKPKELGEAIRQKIEESERAGFSRKSIVSHK